MINLAENGVTCDCGSPRVAPAIVATGEPVICTDCAATFRLDVGLTPISWPAVEAHFEFKAHDLCAFEWHRNGVPLARRRTLPELQASGGQHAFSERVGAVVGVAIVLMALAAIARAVFS